MNIKNQHENNNTNSQPAESASQTFMSTNCGQSCSNYMKSEMKLVGETLEKTLIQLPATRDQTPRRQPAISSSTYSDESECSNLQKVTRLDATSVMPNVKKILPIAPGQARSGRKKQNLEDYIAEGEQENLQKQQ